MATTPTVTTTTTNTTTSTSSERLEARLRAEYPQAPADHIIREPVTIIKDPARIHAILNNVKNWVRWFNESKVDINFETAQITVTNTYSLRYTKENTGEWTAKALWSMLKDKMWFWLRTEWYTKQYEGKNYYYAPNTTVTFTAEQEAYFAQQEAAKAWAVDAELPATQDHPDATPAADFQSAVA